MNVTIYFISLSLPKVHCMLLSSPYKFCGRYFNTSWPTFSCVSKSFRYSRNVTYLLTYLLTPLCRVLLEKLTGLQLVKKFPAFHGTRRFISALTSIRHLSLSWASPIQSIYPHPTSWRSILILSTHLRLGLPIGLLLFGFPSKSLYNLLSSPIRATCPAHLILLDFIPRAILGEEYKSFSSSLCSLLHYPVTSFLLGPNIILNTMFSNTLCFLSSRNVSDQVSHPYKTTGKIIVIPVMLLLINHKVHEVRLPAKKPKK